MKDITLHTAAKLLLAVPAFLLAVPAVRAQALDPVGARHLALNAGGHTALVTQALFTADGKAFITVGEDKAIRFWDAATGQALGAVYGQIGQGSEGKLYAAALSPDGKTLAVGGYAHAYNPNGPDPSRPQFVVRVIKVGSLRPFHVENTQLLFGPIGTVNALAFSPDGKALACGSADTGVYVWRRPDPARPFGDDESGHQGIRTVLYSHKDGILGVAFSPDGGQIAAVNADGSVQLWPASGGAAKDLGKHAAPARAIAWSPRVDGGSVIATGGLDGAIKLWDGGSGRALQDLPNQGQQVTALAFSPDGRRLAWGTGQDAAGACPARVWSPASGFRSGYSKIEVAEMPHDATVQSVAFAPDGAGLVSAGGAGNGVYRWKLAGGHPDLKVVGHGGVVSNVAWSDDGKLLGWKRLGGAARQAYDFVYDLDAAAPVYKTKSIRWSPAATQAGGRTVTVAEDGHSVTLQQGGKRTKIQVQTPDSPNYASDIIHCTALTPDGNVVVGSSFTLALYGQNGQKIRDFIGHTGDVLSVDVSPDGKYLASASVDETVSVWPLTDDSEKAPLLSLFSDTDDRWVAWTPDGWFTASSNGDDLVGFQVNPPQDQVAEAVPLWQYSNFNDRGVISRLRQAGSVDRAVQVAGKEPGAVDKAAIPVIQSVTLEADGHPVRPGDDVKGGQVTLKAHIIDKNSPARRITGVRLSVNHRPVDGVASVSGSGDWQQTVTLKPGANTFSLFAVNDANSLSHPVEYTLRHGAAPASNARRLYMLSVGISTYPGGAIYDLHFPAKDAKDLSTVFRAQEGKLFSRGDVQVDVLSNRLATQDAVRSALKSIRAKTANFGDNDYTVIFVSGHGWSDADHPFCYIPWDVDPHTPDTIERTAVGWKEFQDALSGIPGNVILMLDACHSAGVGGGLKEALDDLSQAQNTDASNLIVLTSCQPEQVSHESLQWGNGAFTRALIDGLTNWRGQVTRGGYVTMGDLAAFVTKRVQDLTASVAQQEGELPQRPQFQVPRLANNQLPLTSVTGRTAQTDSHVASRK